MAHRSIFAAKGQINIALTPIEVVTQMQHVLRDHPSPSNHRQQKQQERHHNDRSTAD